MLLPAEITPNKSTSEATQVNSVRCRVLIIKIYIETLNQQAHNLLGSQLVT